MSDTFTEDVVVRFNPPQEGAQELGRRLLAAARDGDAAAVLDLMARGAPFTTDWLGTSPLHLAAANDQAEVCGVLLRAGASRDCRTKVERTPLQLAAYWGHAAVCDLLLAAGAAVNARDMLRMTALHWAAERGHGAAAAALLRAGADPRARCKFGRTPRQLAAAAGRADLVRLLDAPPSPPSTLPDDVDNETAQAAEFVTMEEFEEMPYEKERTVEPQEEASTVEPSATGDGEGEAAGEGEGAAGESGAARLLRRHGITLQPAEPPGTALRALQAGRTILLSDAGKLMLKESEAEVAPSPAAPAAPTAPAAPKAGLVLRATPVSTHPRGVTVFTLGNKSGDTKLAGKKVQYVSLARSPAAPAAPPRRAPRALKILMNKDKVRKLLVPGAAPAPAPAGPADVEEEEGEEAVVRVPEQFLRSADPAYLRAQLLAATAALHRTTRRLQRAEARLRRYEAA